MRTGLLARADSRGLGSMSKDAQKYLKPTATLVVDGLNGYKLDMAAFPFADVVARNGRNFRDKAEALLEGIDVLLTLETPYDWGLYDWARARGVATVLVVMPEYHRAYLELPQPDVIVNPTIYMQEMFPGGDVLSWPVDTDAIAYRPRTEIAEWLHIAGQPCHHDRNGTGLVLDAFAKLPERRLLIRSQVASREVRKRRELANVRRHEHNAPTSAALYEQGDALVMPRRYAGQCLPMNEAAAAGMPLVCLDRVPENAWTLPDARIPCHITKRDPRRGYDIWDATPQAVAEVVERVSRDPALVADLSRFSRDRALAMSWDVLGPVWLALLEQSVSVRV